MKNGIIRGNKSVGKGTTGTFSARNSGLSMYDSEKRPKG